MNYRRKGSRGNKRKGEKQMKKVKPLIDFDVLDGKKKGRKCKGKKCGGKRTSKKHDSYIY